MDRLRGIAARFADPIIVRACIRGRSGPGLRNPSRQDGAEPADGRGPCLYELQGPPPRGHCGIPAASAQHTIEAAVLTGDCVEQSRVHLTAKASKLDLHDVRPDVIYQAHTVTIGRPTAEWVGVEEVQNARPWAAIGSPALTEECDSAEHFLKLAVPLSVFSSHMPLF
ncbi:uncharacterized protein BO88DRAFT_427420 [Aspergillus vadensis CBS 113365]|uniref:Uncharacterized protein n=1 Tax=Aspergillus vadensis (strain CBS 113365 / IMI 142717 / IBT 24658) TaxID=1448311 RepID=A0A319B4U7_ASPVC|nr:hypothetical protein BO88DRAFT_427420 [Aspergillus vadensis CBS 113365]PYH66814.1 hypothetical protein BO88DRAFT_427420 [Aspergillus vadensis CBS 113365]